MCLLKLILKFVDLSWYIITYSLVKTSVNEDNSCLTPNSLSINLKNIIKQNSESSFEDKKNADYMYSDPQLVEPVHSLKESGRKFPNK